MSFTLASSPLFFIANEVGQFNKFSRLNDEKRKMLMCLLNENTEDELRQDCEEWDYEEEKYFEGKSNLHRLLKSADAENYVPTSRGNFYHDLIIAQRARYEQKILWMRFRRPRSMRRHGIST